jgi:hypothetical protein
MLRRTIVKSNLGAFLSMAKKCAVLPTAPIWMCLMRGKRFATVVFFRRDWH